MSRHHFDHSVDRNDDIKEVSAIARLRRIEDRAEHVGAVFLDVDLRPPRRARQGPRPGCPVIAEVQPLNKTRNRLSGPASKNQVAFPSD
jgi:hypothetical protein